MIIMPLTPAQPVYGSETGNTVTTRGIYIKNAIKGYVPDQDITHPWWSSTAEEWWKPNANRIGSWVVLYGLVLITGRTHTLWLALYQFAFWYHGYVRFS